MKQLFLTLSLACVTLFAFAQDIPVGMRMEVAEVEDNNNDYSLFKYKDEDGTVGYYLSMGRVFKLYEATDEDNNVTSSLSHIDETCIWMGATSDEVFAAIESLLALLDKDPGFTVEFPCRLATWSEKLGDHSMATCIVTKRFLQGKRLCFHFVKGRRTASADLTRSGIKSLRWSYNLYLKIHPNEK